jgi:hypothetical protein
MSLADHVNAASAQTAAQVPRRVSAPTGWEPGVRYDAGRPVEVTVQVPSVPEDEKAWREEIKRVTGLTIPDGRQVEIQQVRYWGNPQEPLVYVRFGISDRAPSENTQDVAALVKVARGNRANRNPLLGTGRTRVVVVADAQIGKTDHRGGTPELLARIENVLGQVLELAKADPCDDLVILDPGDLTEGFENTAQQSRTNDLDFPDQLDAANVILTEIVTTLAARHGSTRVATVPSNHGAWRRGKDRLSKPAADFGLLTHRTVARALAHRDDITFRIPEPWDESLSLRVRGAVLGLAHGHQASQPNGVPAWWAKQTHGGMPTAAATILVTGHFHHLRVEPSGAIDGRARWWMQAPTLDNGSSWWANGGGGSDCEAGLLTFTIDDAGRWDHLRLLTA